MTFLVLKVDFYEGAFDHNSLLHHGENPMPGECLMLFVNVNKGRVQKKEINQTGVDRDKPRNLDLIYGLWTSSMD